MIADNARCFIVPKFYCITRQACIILKSLWFWKSFNLNAIAPCVSLLGTTNVQYLLHFTKYFSGNTPKYWNVRSTRSIVSCRSLVQRIVDLLYLEIWFALLLLTCGTQGLAKSVAFCCPALPLFALVVGFPVLWYRAYLDSYPLHAPTALTNELLT